MGQSPLPRQEAVEPTNSEYLSTNGGFHFAENRNTHSRYVTLTGFRSERQFCVKTTVNIPDKTLRDAMRHTKAKTKREAIVKALEEMNRRHSQAELVKYFGKFDSLMTNEEIEAMEEDDWKSWTKVSKTIRFPRKKK